MTVSVVIITKNEASTIWQCVAAAMRFSDDVIVVDSGSTDQTTQIALALGCRVYHEKWDGYGTNKNKGIALARHNWVFSLDADEIADDELIASIIKLQPAEDNVMYDIRFRSYYGEKQVHYGSWGRDHHVRLFNRNHSRWTEPLVHENLMRPAGTVIKKLAGNIHHYSVKSPAQYRAKVIQYARLNASKYRQDGKKATVVKLYLSPAFHFLKNYIFLLGILDGRRGWAIALMMARHTWLKYHFLSRETGHIKDKYFAGENLSVEY